MAKVKKETAKKNTSEVEPVKPWLANKIAEARKLSEHRAARAARRWGAPAGVALVALLIISSFFLPQNSFQQAKQKLLRKTDNFQDQLILAEELLTNNQFEEAERVLLLAQKHLRGGVAPAAHLGGENILGEQTNPKLKELWQRKHYSDPVDIKKLIAAWEKIIEEKPDYRDAYLQLTYLHYKLYENEKAKEYLQKAIELDPNYELARELKEIIQ